MDALDVRVSAYSSGEIDKAILSGAENVESLCRRSFAPVLDTRYWPYPNVAQNEAWTLWLDGSELISLNTLTAGGITIPAAGYYLEPQQYGPPYNRIEINRGSGYAFSGGSQGPQRSLAAYGLFGYRNDEVIEGTLTASIADGTSTTLTASASLEIGRTLRIDSERMFVTEKSFVTSAQTVQTPLTASLANQTLAVTDGTQFVRRERLLIDAEYMLVVDIAGNNLVVKRAQQGSTLAAHTGSTIYWARQMTVRRGVLGTTAAAHSNGVTVYRYDPPALVEQLNTAYAIMRHLGERSGYAREAGAGSNAQSNASRYDITSMENDCQSAHGRAARQRAI
jgi:hypothetical protein